MNIEFSVATDRNCTEGVITYVSRCYPGGTTNKEIMEDSGILDKPGVDDNVMAKGSSSTTFLRLVYSKQNKE